MKTHARITAAVVLLTAAAFCAVLACWFCAQIASPRGDWLDVLGAGVYVVLTVGFVAIVPWTSKENR